MLSILIPVYNTSVIQLVSQISNMAKSTGFDYELRIADDASTNEILKSENQKLAQNQNCYYHTIPENHGRTATRQFLAESANYNYLLFLDADVMPLRKNFLQVILKHIEKAQVIFGGIVYPKTIPEKEYALHYKYGKNREVKSIAARNKKPYLALISQHLLIEKSVFLACNPAEENAYGLDPYFSHRLEQQQVSVLHIDNPTVHLGLETSEHYLVKTRTGLQTLVTLEKAKKISENYRPLQRVAYVLKKLRLQQHVLSLLQKQELKILKNLYSSQPNLRLFDLYRLLYYLKLKQDA